MTATRTCPATPRRFGRARPWRRQARLRWMQLRPARHFPVRRGRGRLRGRRYGPRCRRGPAPVRSAACAGPARPAGRDPARVRPDRLADPPLFRQFRGQRHSAGDRRAQALEPGRARPAGVAEDRPRQDRADACRAALRRLDRARRPDRSGRRLDHVRDRPPVAGAPAGPDPGRRLGRDRRRLQHAARRGRFSASRK